MKTARDVLETRLTESALAMRNVAETIEQLSVFIMRGADGVLRSELDQEQCVARLRAEADRNMAVLSSYSGQEGGC